MDIETETRIDPEDEYGFRIYVRMGQQELPNTSYFYVWDSDEQAIRHSIHVDSRYQGIGVGTLLIQRFQKEVGSGHPMVGEIDHVESQRYVLDSPWIFKAAGRAIDLPADFFMTIPAVHKMTKSGLTINRVMLTYFPHTNSVMIPFWGRT